MSEGIPGRRQPSTDRTEAFSDGVFAIAITLLVLTIEPPTPNELGSRQTLAAALLGDWSSYLAYLVAFLTIAVTWMNHHAAFAKLDAVDPVLQWWNLLLLLAVALSPFPTALVADYLPQSMDDRSAKTAVTVFALVTAIRPLIWVMIWRHLNRHHELLEPDMTPHHGRLEVRRASVGLALSLIAAAVALAVPLLALAMCLAIAAFYAVTAQGRHDRPEGG